MIWQRNARLLLGLALAAGACASALGAWPAIAANPADNKTARGGVASVRAGDHPGFGRIVIDDDSQAAYQLEHDGDRVVLRFVTPVALGSAPRPPHNVTAIRISGAVATLTVQHGATVHASRIAGRIVLDILDPSEPTPPDPHRSDPAVKAEQKHQARAEAPPSKLPAPPVPPNPPSLLAASPELGGRSPDPAPSPPPLAASPPPASTPVLTAARPPVEATPLPMPTAADSSGLVDLDKLPPPMPDVATDNIGPVGLAAYRIRLPPGTKGSAFLVPFDKTTGAAAFREGDDTFVVFDERRPVDMAALRNDPVFRTAAVTMLPAGTLFRVPLPPNLSIAIGRLAQGWRVAALPTASLLQPITETVADGRLNLTADQPSHVISMADPRTGSTLLIGTQGRAGQAVATGRDTAEFVLRPTVLGVVAEPIADSIELKTEKNGFSLSRNGGKLAMSPASSQIAAMIDAAHLTRRLDFSNMRTDALVRRLSSQLLDAARAQPLARGPKHHLAAESMMALGLEAEAGSMLEVAAEQDPREAASPDTAVLGAIADLLAGRIADTSALDDPRLTGTDEIALWRAVRTAMQDNGSPAAAAVFAATAPLVLLYPAPIRDRILPLVLETMLKGGEVAPAERILDQRKDDPRLAYARALRTEADGNTDQALEMLDALAAGHDQFDRIRAAEHAVQIRLATGQIDKARAADALEKLTYAWRGDDRELAMRQQIADLREQTGQWRNALSTLRQAEADFPEHGPAIHARLKSMFAEMMHKQDSVSIPPLEFVAMVDENADLVPHTGDEEGVDQPLAERLLALDLPDRAEPVLRKLLASARTDESKARYGASLATLQTREKNDTAALATLDASEANDVPADVAQERTLIRAGAVARTGDPKAATDLLAKLATPGADAARAQLQEDAKDWPAAEQAWKDCAAATFPDSGMLDPDQAQTLVRLATATARAGDDAGLTALRKTYQGRVPAGSMGDMFRLLTVEPIRDKEDIARSKQEVGLAAALPADLKAIQAKVSAR